ncbi:hypothetical protein [Jannaschia seohaensis]|uniref:VPLPA-CTERM protein sorting domain-containing protein n=1 Tax=Jannaschia seohaensis TaxID=475081 RepID=A0A2Y9AYI3_9RHOB|nr:hypothetical protein [Jannaschia seohaensis]PWJ16253.1 hypothetical protein BCF38_109138 [Jannaschia seohaensis]SSA49330.1 hypothetical protein SAMN05421539_109138 [Jannaschia seohaensis]
MNVTIFAATAAALVLAGSMASAVPVAFTDLAAWTSANSSRATSVEDLEAATVGNIPGLSVDLGLFTSTLAASSVVHEIELDDTLPTKALEVYLSANQGTTMTWDDFDVGPVFGIGMDIGSLDANGITITVNGTPLFFSGSNPSFIGVTDTAPIQSLVFSSQNEQFDVDNIRFATATIPLPAGIACLLGALGLLGLTAGRRTRRA